MAEEAQSHPEMLQKNKEDIGKKLYYKKIHQ